MVSDRALEQSGVQPQPGTSSEYGQLHVCAHGIREFNYGSDRVLKTARTLYRCWLSCKDAFPTPDMKGRWAADVWNEACLRTKTRPNSSPKDEEACLFFCHV